MERCESHTTKEENLFESLTNYVELRNDIVHAGKAKDMLSESGIQKMSGDFCEAVERIYTAFGTRYEISLSHDF